MAGCTSLLQRSLIRRFLDFLLGRRKAKSGPTDTEMLDWLADNEVFRVLGGYNITDRAVEECTDPNDMDHCYGLLRKHMRMAVRKAMEKS